MRQLFLLWLVLTTCEACARTRGGGGDPGSASPGSPAPGSPAGEATEAPPKVCPPLMAFTPEPDNAFQLVTPPTTTVSGDTTTATCPAGGTSFLLPDGTSTTDTLSCSTTTGTWSFSDHTAFDATTTSITCGAKCAPCMITEFGDSNTQLPTFSDTTDKCNTPTGPACDNSVFPTFVGANMDGTRFIGNAIVAPVSCVGGKWVDASNAVYDNLVCNVEPTTCGDIKSKVDLTTCNTDTGKTCVAPLSAEEMMYSGTNALLIGQNTLSIVCPDDAPILYLLFFGPKTPITLYLNMPLSEADANLKCEYDEISYLVGGTSIRTTRAFACVPA